MLAAVALSLALTGCATQAPEPPAVIQTVRTVYVPIEPQRLTMPLLTATRPPPATGYIMNPEVPSDLLQNMMLMQEEVIAWESYAYALEDYIGAVEQIVNGSPNE